MLELQGAWTLCEGMSRTKHAKGNRSGHLSEMQPKGTLLQGDEKRKALQDFRRWDNCRGSHYKEKTQQGVTNLEEFVCNYYLVINIVRSCKS
jgi:hypothetical protein